MAGTGAGSQPLTAMRDHELPGRPPTRGRAVVTRRELIRVAVLLLSLFALLLTSSALNLVASTRAQSPKRAVIVSGPVHSLTDRYLGYARAMANAAEAQGMEVTRIFHPDATVERVKNHASGADLFIYVGHGNGWPSAYGSLDERTKNGLGLDVSDPAQRSSSTVVYKGADWLRENVEFAPNAVVILSHLSYASGNASSGMPIPSREVAVERVDNFANGFLASGARVVWALGWQPGADVINALWGEDATMDAVFMTRYREEVDPINGWVGTDPGYYDSVRTPGARVHIDPHPADGYLRGITGDLDFTTTEWRNTGAPAPDTEPPVISEVSISQAAATLAAEDASLPIFTPNGDGISDTVKVTHVLSENAFLGIRVVKDDIVVREMSIWSMRGRGSTTWDGRRDDGEYIGEGRFRIEITPTDRAGNVGQAAVAKALALTALTSPAFKPGFFYPSDGDALAATSILGARLLRPATLSWVIRDASGAVVRHGGEGVAAQRGPVRFEWDGRDDAGQFVPQGTYLGRIRVTRPAGSYGHEVPVRIMPFDLTPTTWKPRRGDELRLWFTSAEPMKGKPIVSARLPGIPSAELRVTKVNPTTFKALLRTKGAERPGKVTVKVVGTDTGDGTQTQAWGLKLS